ncbi:MAG: DUF1425 domain-containing protein [Alphaproteobacteria bacterium]|nr:DUF1425 domain-containing protein [Alphaproteobacteria bacterium]
MKNKILLIMLSVFLLGCASPIEYDREIFSITSDVKLESINSVSNVRERDGQVLVQVQGVSSKNQSVYYKVEWFDYNFINISSDLSRWKRANLRENSDFLWKMVAPSKRAVSYKIYITREIGDGLLD